MDIIKTSTYTRVCCNVLRVDHNDYYSDIISCQCGAGCVSAYVESRKCRFPFLISVILYDSRFK